MKLRYTPAAIVDLEEIFEYISVRLSDPDAARSIISNLYQSCALLKNDPDLGMELRRKVGRDVEGRCLVSGKYLIVYEVDEAIRILRIFDTRTDYIRHIFE